MVVMYSQRFLYVFIDSHRLSMVLTGSQWFSEGSHFCMLIDILDVPLVIKHNSVCHS